MLALAKLQVRQAYHGPVDDQGGDHQRHQQLERLARHQVVDEYAQQGCRGGDGDGHHRHTALVGLEQAARAVALLGQTKQHAAVAVDTAVVNRQGCGQYHHVEHGGHQIAVQRVEDHDEGTAAFYHLTPGVEGHQHGQGADVEDEDPVDHLIGGLGDALLGIVGLGGRDADQLEPAEREHDHRHRHHQTADAVGEEAALCPEVADAGVRAAVAAGQQVAAKANHADDGHHLDDGEPELHLAKRLDVGEVDGVDQHEEEGRRHPGRDLGPPVLDINAHRGQLGHAHQHIEHPVVPAGSKTGEVTPVFVGEVAEGAGYRLFHHHLAQLAHDQEGDKTTDGIAKQHGGARHLDGLGNAEKQAGADGAAQCDELDMAVFQTAFQLLAVLLKIHSSFLTSSEVIRLSSRPSGHSM